MIYIHAYININMQIDTQLDHLSTSGILQNGDLLKHRLAEGGGEIKGSIKYAHHFTMQLSLELVEPRMCAIFALLHCTVPEAGVNCFCTADLVVFPISVSLHMLSSTSVSLMKQMVAYSCLLLVESHAYTSSSDTLECSV